jgi:hypothetical protein
VKGEILVVKKNSTAASVVSYSMKNADPPYTLA